MRSTKFNCLLLALVGILSLNLAPTHAEDWPTWRGPRGDNISHEKNLLNTWPETGPKLLWSVNVGAGFSTPIAADGKIYFFGMIKEQESLTCLDATTGKILWSQSYNPGRTGLYAGTRSTPTLEAGKIYSYGNSGNLLCTSAADGKVIWKFDLLKELNDQPIGWGESSSPLIVGNRIFVQGGIDGPLAAAVDKTTGKLIWQAEAKGTSSYAAPILITVDGVKQLIMMAGKDAYAMNPENGKTIWSVPFKTAYETNAADPIYRDHHLFITSEYDHGSQLLKLTGTSAKRLWEKDNKALQGKFPSPILDGNVMYLNSAGTLKCVAWPDCQLKWEDKSYKLGVGGSLLRFDDKLVLLGENGLASLVKATPEGVQKIGQFEAFPKGKEIWSSPLIYQGKLYLKGGDDLKCYDISEK